MWSELNPVTLRDEGGLFFLNTTESFLSYLLYLCLSIYLYDVIVCITYFILLVLEHTFPLL